MGGRDEKTDEIERRVFLEAFLFQQPNAGVAFIFIIMCMF